MIHLQMLCHSDILRTDISVRVLLPDPRLDSVPERCDETAGLPVLYLLHDLSGDETAFLRRSALERHLEGYKAAVVLPSIGRSYGVDTHEGNLFGTFLADELPALMEATFPVSRHASRRYVAGVDAGGYGAFRLALSRPERYAGAAALSAPLDLNTLFQLPDEEILHDLVRVFGPADALESAGHLLQTLLPCLVRNSLPCPGLFAACGADDFFLQDNRRFAALAGRLNADLRYQETTGGHDWTAWDAMLPVMLDWMFHDMPRNPDEVCD